MTESTPSIPQITLKSNTTIVLKVNDGADTAVTVAADKSVTLAGAATVTGALTATGGVVGAVTGTITDANGNEILKSTAAASAVNELTITNAAAGAAVQLATTGGDTSIDFQLIAKGTEGNILLGGYGGVAATAGAATGASQRGYVTSETLTTAAGAAYTLTLTNPHIKANSVLLAGVENGTNTQGIPIRGECKAVAGTGTIKIWNLHASQAFNGTIVISYFIA